MEKVKGYESLTPEQQKLLKAVNRKHKAGVGTEYKDGWTPVKVLPDCRKLKVWFKNGHWLYYTIFGEWY